MGWTQEATAVTYLDHGDAVPLKSGRRVLGVQGVFGDEIRTVGAGLRFGLAGPIDLTARAGLTEIADRVGFEAEVAPRMALFGTRQTAGIADIALVGYGSVLRTGEVLALGADAGAIASRRFKLSSRLTLFVAGTLGLATTYTDVNGGGGDTDYDTGLLAAGAVGVDVARGISVILEGRRRDDFERLGLAVTFEL
ncbi:MAG: hypothetical protein ACE366_05580 [Bradymonadia bacterium]